MVEILAGATRIAAFALARTLAFGLAMDAFTELMGLLDDSAFWSNIVTP